MHLYFALQVLLSGIISGMILFQSAYVAPTVFTSLPEATRGPFLRSMFPKLFKTNSVLGFIFLVLSFTYPLTFVLPYAIGTFTCLAGIICIMIIPATNQAKDKGNDKIFAKLHRISVVLTMIVLISHLFWIFMAYSRLPQV